MKLHDIFIVFAIGILIISLGMCFAYSNPTDEEIAKCMETTNWSRERCSFEISH